MDLCPHRDWMKEQPLFCQGACVAEEMAQWLLDSRSKDCCSIFAMQAMEPESFERRGRLNNAIGSTWSPSLNTSSPVPCLEHRHTSSLPDRFSCKYWSQINLQSPHGLATSCSHEHDFVSTLIPGGSYDTLVMPHHPIHHLRTLKFVQTQHARLGRLQIICNQHGPRPVTCAGTSSVEPPEDSGHTTWCGDKWCPVSNAAAS